MGDLLRTARRRRGGGIALGASRSALRCYPSRVAVTKQFDLAFAELRSIMLDVAGELVIVRDEPGDLYIDTGHVMKNKKPLFFGAVNIRKRYVAYHLMPVYVCPDLLENVSASLRSRMQGKSCFNFTRTDPVLNKELAQLTKAGYHFYRREGYR